MIILILFNVFKDINSLIVLFIFFSAFYIVRAVVIIGLQKKIKGECKATSIMTDYTNKT